MKIKQLYTLSQFIDELAKGLDCRTEYNELWSLINDYNDFLKAPLKKEMFVLCDNKGNELEELKMCCGGGDCGCMGMPINVSSQEEIDIVLEAENKVIFKGVLNKWEHNIGDEYFTLQFNDVLLPQEKNQTLLELATATNGELELKNIEL